MKSHSNFRRTSFNLWLVAAFYGSLRQAVFESARAFQYEKAYRNKNILLQNWKSIFQNGIGTVVDSRALIEAGRCSKTGFWSRWSYCRRCRESTPSMDLRSSKSQFGQRCLMIPIQVAIKC